MDKYVCIPCEYVYDPNKVILKTELLPEPGLKTSPMIGSALYALLIRMSLKK